jgi:ABC-type lipoprotein release transport system permease subunit
LGTALAYRLINEMSEDIVGLAYRVPWLNILVVIVIAYGASLLTTFLPARQAAKVYPAEALRFE